MKKIASMILVLAMLLSLCISAGALNYQQHFINEATFETLEEARANAADFLQSAMPDRVYTTDPVMDGYPAGTTWVYRSADMYHCVSAAFRMNTNLLVYTDKHFDDKDAAYAYLEELGLIELCDAATGSVVLVTPIAATGFAQADQYAYYRLQTAMTNIGYSITNAEGAKIYYAENAYFGGLTYRYLIGIDGGATFVNNYIAPVLDDVSRLAGMLLIGGSVEAVYDVAGYVPVYLVNAPANVVEKYKTANGVDAYTYFGDEETFYCQAWPLRCVKTVANAEVNADFVQSVYYNFLIKAMRIPVIKNAVNGTSNAYSAYNMNQAPYSLCARNAIIDGVTADGLYVTEYHNDTFIDIFADSTGEYLDTWFEILPEEVVNHTAAEHSVPLLLAVHGGDDDPIQFVDEMGLLTLAGEERFAMVAPAYQKLWRTTPVMIEALAAVTRYMLETYPELDPSRVYTTGYSMGGGSSATVLAANPDLFAAGVAMATPTSYIGDEDAVALIEKIGMPMMIVTSTYDVYYRNDRPNAGILAALNRYCGYNGIPEHEYDFDLYPLSGFKGDLYSYTTLNDEYGNHTWYRCNEKGEPFVALNLTEDLQHALYPEYGRLAWEFCKHYSRNPETGELTYTAIVR